MTTTSLKEVHGLDAVHYLVGALAAAPNLQTIYREAIAVLVSALRVDRASILLFDGDGVMRFKAWHGLSDGYRNAVEGHSPWAAEARGVRPMAVRSAPRNTGGFGPLMSSSSSGFIPADSWRPRAKRREWPQMRAFATERTGADHSAGQRGLAGRERPQMRPVATLQPRAS